MTTPASSLEGDPATAASIDDRPAPAVVAFDIGEVLIDETRVWSLWADLVGVSPLTFAAAMGAAIVQGLDHEAAFDHLVPHVQWRDLAAEHESRLGGLGASDLYDDVRECCAALTDAGFRVIVAGNQPALRSAQIKALTLSCDAVITSEELGIAKPDPAFFTTLCDHMQIADPADVLYVGDRVDNDVLPASAVGMRTCWLRRGPWGRLQDLPDDVEVDVSLEGLGELPTIMATWREEFTA
ncbi:MAG: HAD family hydrolase [Nitriliruptoraceae bacterium]